MDGVAAASAAIFILAVKSVIDDSPYILLYNIPGQSPRAASPQVVAQQYRLLGTTPQRPTISSSLHHNVQQCRLLCTTAPNLNFQRPTSVPDYLMPEMSTAAMNRIAVVVIDNGTYQPFLAHPPRDKACTTFSSLQWQ